MEDKKNQSTAYGLSRNYATEFLRKSQIFKKKEC